MQESYLSALELLDNKTAALLMQIGSQTQNKIQEIRLRSGYPLTVSIGGEIYFVGADSSLSKNFSIGVITERQQVLDTVKKITGSSVYSHLDEIQNGFISMPYGNRAGISGVFRQEKFCEASSVNIRIAHECKGVAKNIISTYSGGSVLICGPPSSGKTTFLRDLVRGLSNGEGGRFYKISVIDTRYEIAANTGGVPHNDIGINTDVFSGRNKPEGIEAAIRSMSPEIVAFDEIGTMAELEAVKSSINCGTYIITTAHIGSIDELYKRNVTRQLIENCFIDRIIFLKYPGCEPVSIDVRNNQLCF